MGVSKAQKNSAKKYQDSNCMRISLILSKEVGEILLNHIAKKGSTKNGFIIQAIKEKIERETGENFQDLLAQMQTAEEGKIVKSAEDSTTEKGGE
ncbi:MAG: hypothetical protein IJI84_04165 [Clostridia bacterium]|nr:hypothetical protein [Clostridia bacterium]